MSMLAHWEKGTITKELAWAAVIAAAGICIAWLPLDLAFALVGGTALALLTLIRPEYGIYALVFAIPFGSVRQIQISGFNIDVSEICVALVIASWLAAMVARRAIIIPRLPLLLPLAVFTFVLVASWFSALSLAASVKETLKWVQILLIYLFVGSTFNEKRVRSTITLILIAAVVAAMLGVYQFFGRVGPDGFLWHTPVGLFMRAYSTFQQPNPFGGYLGLVAPLAYALWITSFSSSERGAGLISRSASGVWRLVTTSSLYAAITALLVLSILMTWSRGAILGLVAAFIVINVQRSRRAAIIFFLIVLLLIGLGALQALPEAVTQRFVDFLPFLSIPDVNTVEVNPTNFAIVQRLAHWTAAWKMFEEHPWSGIGIGNYNIAYPGHAPPAWPDSMGHAHNYYLNIAAEAGLVGLFAYLGLWIIILWRTWRSTYRLSGYALGIALGVLGVLVHFSVHNFVDNLYVHGMYLHIAILLGCLAALLEAQKNTKHP
jgi:putative inorganic carbon (HCO3(-)) transporter